MTTTIIPLPDLGKQRQSLELIKDAEKLRENALRLLEMCDGLVHSIFLEGMKKNPSYEKAQEQVQSIRDKANLNDIAVRNSLALEEKDPESSSLGINEKWIRIGNTFDDDLNFSDVEELERLIDYTSKHSGEFFFFKGEKVLVPYARYLVTKLKELQKEYV